MFQKNRINFLELILLNTQNEYAVLGVLFFFINPRPREILPSWSTENLCMNL